MVNQDGLRDGRKKYELDRWYLYGIVIIATMGFILLFFGDRLYF